MTKPSVAIIGAGAAGMMCAGTLYKLGITPTVFETMQRPGRKVGITGKGRCNLTNNCTPEDFIQNIPTNPRFMYGAINSFSPQDMIELTEFLGVPVKTERGNRVFPVSDKARDMVDALCKYMHVKPITDTRITDVTYQSGKFKLTSNDKNYFFDIVVIATGGASYSATGSRGDGYKFAEKSGHTIVDLKPSLIPLETKGRTARDMMGVSLKNVAIKVRDKQNGKILYEDFGEMMFTHFGITGPVVLSASSHIREYDGRQYSFEIDLKPALDEEKLDKRLLSDFEKNSNKDLANAMGLLLPKGMIMPFIRQCGLDPHKKLNVITKAERKTILQHLKCFCLDISGPRPIEEAIVTSGGVSTKELSPKTMESKLVPNLYFAGEIIDVDGYTGGFNLQIAYSTGVCAARAIYNKINTTEDL